MIDMVKIILVSILLFQVFQVNATILDRKDVQEFLENMSSKHGFDRDKLNDLFMHVKLSDKVVKAISKPAERLPWYRYRTIFLQSDRIELGVKFWEENRVTLQTVEDDYGVPAEIIVAIIGVETRYGKNKGGFKVINSLATLAFNYPRRSDFFIRELEQYLLLTREQGIDPLTVEGSYAGAMGIPQFISSSYRQYAIDFNKDGVTDIWNNTIDAIGSVGNYFKEHGWKPGHLIALPARIEGDSYKNALNRDLKPSHSTAQLANYGISTEPAPPSDMMAKVLELETRHGKEYWLGFENFYVITRYNHSMLYAMAVYQLGMEIRSRYLKQQTALK